MLDVNPAKQGVENPQRRRTEKRPFESWAELDAIAERLGPRFGPIVIFATATGLRPGEWIALEYRDIDREARFAYVRRAFSYQRNAIDAASAGLESEGRALVILATGLGKTVVAGEVIESQLRGRSSEDVLVVAHVKELVRRGRVAEVVASSGLQFGPNEQAAFQSNEPALPTALFSL